MATAISSLPFAAEHGTVDVILARQHAIGGETLRGARAEGGLSHRIRRYRDVEVAPVNLQVVARAVQHVLALRADGQHRQVAGLLAAKR